MKHAKSGAAVFLAVQMAVTMQFATVANAEIVTTETAFAKYSHLAERQALLSELQKQDVKDQLIQHGVDPTEVELRLAALTDAEIQSIFEQLRTDSAGAGIESIIGTIGSIFIILLITDILCLTRIFNFTNCIR